MKHEIGVKKPEYLVEDWPGKFEAFSWLEYVVSVPNPIFLITTLKKNNLPNANLHSWGLLLGNGDCFWSVLSVLKHQHTYDNIVERKEWCINYPSFTHYPECFTTIYKNTLEDDEIKNAGFTLEESKVIKTPRIKECIINLECKYEWEKSLYEGGNWALFGGKVVNVAIDDKAIADDPVKRLSEMQLMYNIRSTVNPINGNYYGPNTLGLINEVVKIFSDDGYTKKFDIKGL